jgi:hypothetical protein
LPFCSACWPNWPNHLRRLADSFPSPGTGEKAPSALLGVDWRHHMFVQWIQRWLVSPSCRPFSILILLPLTHEQVLIQIGCSGKST